MNNVRMLIILILIIIPFLNYCGLPVNNLIQPRTSDQFLPSACHEKFETVLY